MVLESWAVVVKVQPEDALLGHPEQLYPIADGLGKRA